MFRHLIFNILPGGVLRVLVVRSFFLSFSVISFAALISCRSVGGRSGCVTSSVFTRSVVDSTPTNDCSSSVEATLLPLAPFAAGPGPPSFAFLFCPVFTNFFLHFAQKSAAMKFLSTKDSLTRRPRMWWNSWTNSIGTNVLPLDMLFVLEGKYK